MKMVKLTGNSNNHRIKIQTAILIMTTIGLLIAAATAMTGFPSITPVLATPLTFGPPEQVINDTGTDATTIMPATTSGQEQQGQQPISIIKDGTNSYLLSAGSSSIGSFDTTYRIAGESSAVTEAENLIISTITSDYSSSPIIGYVMGGNTTNATAASAGAGGAATTTLPNPFASPEQISERITSELRRVIGEAAENDTNNMATVQEESQQQQQQQQLMEIKCVFGMALDDMRCDNYIPSVGATEDVAMSEGGIPNGSPFIQGETFVDDSMGIANVPEE
jgi:hypothetical protein